MMYLLRQSLKSIPSFIQPLYNFVSKAKSKAPKQTKPIQEQMIKIQHYPKWNALSLYTRYFSLTSQECNLFVHIDRPLLQRLSENQFKVMTQCQVCRFILAQQTPTIPKEQSWQYRQSISFNFAQVCQILTLDAKQPFFFKIDQAQESDGKTKIRTLTIENKLEEQQVHMNLLLRKDREQEEPVFIRHIFAKFSLREFKLIIEHLENNLAIMSGYQYMLDHNYETAIRASNMGIVAQNEELANE